MDRRNYYNILDFGSSKIRFTVFDDKLNKAYTDTKPVILEDNFINHIEVINETIKKAEKNLRSYKRYTVNFRHSSIINYRFILK